MCGRYYIDEEMAEELQNVVQGLDRKRKEIRMTGDICPSMQAPVICGGKQARKLEIFRWGFKKYNSTGLIINARAETAADKRMFREALQYRRCIVPARGFYEWDSSKIKFKFTGVDGKLLYMAGIFQEDEEQKRFVILTTKANTSMQPVHDRMPVILPQSSLETWLSASAGEILTQVPPILSRHSEMEQMTLEF